LSIAISPDGNHAVVGSLENEIRVWDFTTGKLIKTVEGHKGEVDSVVFSHDGKYIISGSSDKTIKIWQSLLANS